MSEIPPDPGQASSARHSGRVRTPARKVLEDRVTTRQLQQMMHSMDTSQASNKISVEVNELSSLIVALSQQVTQLTNELTTTRDELIATKNELIAAKNQIATKNELQVLKAELKAMMQTQLSNIVIPPSASPSYAAIACTPPKSQPSDLPFHSSRSLTPSTMTNTLFCTIDTTGVKEDDKNKAQPGTIREAIELEIRTGTDKGKWRCTAVTRDPRNAARIRVTCRDDPDCNSSKTLRKR